MASHEIEFGCGRCQIRLHKNALLIGKRYVCPQCGYMGIVPEESSVDPQQLDSYSLMSSQGAVLRNPITVVTCFLCHARLDVYEEDIETYKECPDCGRKIFIHKPQEKTQDKAPYSDESYALKGEEPAETVSPQESLTIPVYCSVCHTLMHAAPDQDGVFIICPDCGTRTQVKARDFLDSLQERRYSQRQYYRQLKDLGSYDLKDAEDINLPRDPHLPPFVRMMCSKCKAQVSVTEEEISILCTVQTVAVKCVLAGCRKLLR